MMSNLPCGYNEPPDFNDYINAQDDAVKDYIKQLESQLSAMRERAEKAEAALKLISSIEDKMYGGDWEEIEEAREIANKALLKD